MSQEWYVSLECAREELLKRFSLRKEVERWWKESIRSVPPDIDLFDIPTAIFARQLATARYEDIVFDLMAKKAGLSPLWLEYTGDVMSDRSPLKRSYLRLSICCGRGKNGGFRQLETLRLADITASKCKTLNEIQTPRGILPEVHRRTQDEVIPSARRRDLTGWFSRVSWMRRYDALLSLSIAHSVMFEDYHGGESGEELTGFTRNKVEPAWKRVSQLFGQKPLIVKMPWKPEFAWYPIDGEWPKHGIVPEDLLRGGE